MERWTAENEAKKISQFWNTCRDRSIKILLSLNILTFFILTLAAFLQEDKVFLWNSMFDAKELSPVWYAIIIIIIIKIIELN